MNSKRMFYVMCGLLGIFVVAVAASAYLATGMLKQQATKLDDLKLSNEVLQHEQTSLIKAKKDIEKYRELDRIAKTIVPKDKDQALTVREIVKLASESGINPDSITFPTSTLGATASGKPTTSSAGSNLTQLLPVKELPGVYIQQITVIQSSTNTVPYDRFIGFLGRLEQNRRTAQVSSIALQPLANDRNKLAFTLTLSEYIKP
jgi:hypothetical protein